MSLFAELTPEERTRVAFADLAKAAYAASLKRYAPWESFVSPPNSGGRRTSSPYREAVSERAKARFDEAVEMHLAGESFLAIATILGITEMSARAYVRRYYRTLNA